MTNTNSFPASTFAQIYQTALQSQLQKIGSNLASFRHASHKDVQSVAEAVNLRPEILLRIESGQHNFRIKTLVALCDYYNINIESIMNQGELLSFKLS
jgi:transcriptional regulator with XRE-family HTH domain